MADSAYAEVLKASAKHLTQRGKGILAADESTGTIGKRLATLSLPNTEETRRSLREVLICARGNEQAYAGVILYKETLYQSDSSGKPFVHVLREKGILAGVKVDGGLQAVRDSAGETTTDGLDGLAERCAAYFKQGARFAKWRAALRIDVHRGLPTDGVVRANAVQLAKYARIAQSEGLLPIVEPEIMIDGNHDQHVSASVAETVIGEVYKALREEQVALELTLLKPMMIMPGVCCAARKQVTADMVARETLKVMKKVVPKQVAGIMFLSGGMSEAEATANLNALNVLAAQQRDVPWHLSFSFGRALQHSAMKLWDGQARNAARAMAMAARVAAVNGLAQRGLFDGEHPALRNEPLYEGFRGWKGHAPPPSTPAAAADEAQRAEGKRDA